LKNGGCGGYSVIKFAWISCGLRFGNIVNARTWQGAITIVGQAASMLHEKRLVDAPKRPEVTSHMRRVAKGASVIHFTLSGQALDLFCFTQPSNG
jgi:hypothetical protein